MLLFVVAALAQALEPSMVDQLAAGRCPEPTVLRSAGEQGDPAGWLSLAWCLGRDPQGDLGVLREAVEKLSGTGQDYARLILIEALVDRDLAKEAAPEIEKLPAARFPAGTSEQARILRDRVWLGMGRDQDARSDLKILTEGPNGNEARFWLARAAEARGDKEVAIKGFQKIWASNRSGDWDDKAEERLKGLGVTGPDLQSDDGKALAKERLATLTARQRHSEALEVMKSLSGGTPPTTKDGLLSWAEAHFRARAYEDAEKLYGQALGAPEVADGYPEAVYNYGLSAIRGRGDHDFAVRVYERLIALHPATAEADLASFKLGYLEIDRKDCAAARKKFEVHLKARPQSKHLDETLWFAGRCAWTMGDTAAAKDAWEKLVSQRPDSGLAVGARYWLARLAGKKKADDEKAQLSALVTKHPTSGYAWFAAQRTGKAFPARTYEGAPLSEALRGRAEVGRALVLRDAGLREWARAELKAAIPALSSGGKEVALETAALLVELGDYRAAQTLARPYCTTPWEAQDPQAIEACLPRPERRIVEAQARKYGIDPNLAYAVMTAESSLDPGAVSIAGALGLMQVMPAEGDRLMAEAWGSGPFRADDLLMGPFNAGMGTTELGLKAQGLKGLLAGGDMPAVIASYNGGEEAVRRWRGDSPTLPDADEFSEDIPFSETRQYVKRVLGFWMAYRWAYGDSVP